MPAPPDPALQRLVDRAQIEQALARYARAVDRGDWQALHSVYHPDAHDDHVEFQGGLLSLIAWLEERFEEVESSVHFLGNCLIEFAGPDRALVETYFTSIRLRPPAEDESAGLAPDDAMARESHGRYVDLFENRAGAWRIARRQVVLDARFAVVARGGRRAEGSSWGRRDGSDPVQRARSAVLADR
jgi:hypothetical protein